MIRKATTILSILLVTIGLVACDNGADPAPPDPGKKSDGDGKKAGDSKPAVILSTDSSQFPVTRTNPDTGKTWTILRIMTDNGARETAKANAEDVVNAHGDLVGAVGLWAYNPPLILQAVKAANKTGQIKIIGFDENIDTLQGIQDGTVVGTIVQNPYEFGFRSVEYLAAIARGEKDKVMKQVPEDLILAVPERTITKDNVDEFKEITEKIQAGNGPIPKHPEYGSKDNRVKVAFIINQSDPFWELARAGCNKAGEEFGVDVDFRIPANGLAAEQQTFIEDLMTTGAGGVAISPVDAANQTDILNKAAKVMPVICQDSDAPDSDRLFYLGTDNYAAGRAAGKMVADSCPNGGKIVILVGKMEVRNAQERSQGVIDVLLGQKSQ